MRAKIVEYNSNYKDVWNEFNANSKNSFFMFDRNYMDYHSDRFQDNSLMFYDNKNRLIALFPANIKDNILYSHQGLTYGGFITNENMKQDKMLSCFLALKEYAKQNNINSIIYKSIPNIYHQIPSNEDEYALFINRAKILKIEPSTTILLSNPCKMSKGRKGQISKAKQENVIIEQSNDFETFINLENEILKEYHNTKAIHNSKELKLLNSRFPEKIQLWVVKYNNKIVAGTLLFISNQVIHTQYMAANEKAREIGALDYLIKILIDKYTQTHKYFDFGISSESDGNILNDGLISQKESFGGRTTTYKTWQLFIGDNNL